MFKKTALFLMDGFPNMSYEFVQYTYIGFRFDLDHQKVKKSEKSFQMDLDKKYLKYGLDFARLGLLKS